MILSFKNSFGESRILGYPETIKEAFEDINKFLDDHNYRSYYKRINFYEDEWEIDCGSWSEFFYLYSLPEDAEEQLNAMHEENKDE